MSRQEQHDDDKEGKYLYLGNREGREPRRGEIKSKAGKRIAPEETPWKIDNFPKFTQPPLNKQCTPKKKFFDYFVLILTSSIEASEQEQIFLWLICTLLIWYTTSSY